MATNFVSLFDNFNQDPLLGISISDEIIAKSDFGSKIYLGTYKGNSVHIKVIPGIFQSKTFVDKDVAELTKLQENQNVLQYFGGKLLDHYTFLVSEVWKTNLEASFLQGSLPLPELDILQQSALGLEFLHNNNIIHGNLKPINVLFTQSIVKLSDYGMQNIRSELLQVSLESNIYIGVLDWSPPEIIRHYQQRQYQEVQTKEGDVFSLGCLYYAVVHNGSHPFGDILSRTSRILHNLYVFDENGTETCNADAIPLISSMISCDCRKRPTIGLVLQNPIFGNQKKNTTLSDASIETTNDDQRLKAVSKNEDEVANFEPKISTSFEKSKTAMTEKQMLTKIDQNFSEDKPKYLEQKNLADKEVAGLLVPLIEKYNAEMVEVLNDNKMLEENDIYQHHKDITEIINRWLDIKLQSSSASFQETCKTILDAELNSEFHKYLQQVEQNIREHELKARNFIQNRCSKYESELITIAQEASDKVEVKLYHVEYIEKLKQEFENDINLFSKQSQRRKDFNSKLDARLADVLKSVMRNVTQTIQSKEKAEKLTDGMLRQYLEDYMSKMQDFIDSQDFISDDQLLQQHKVLLEASLNELNRNIKLTDINLVAEKLKAKILAQYQQITTLKNLMQDCHSYYSTKMQECLGLDPDITKVHRVHTSTMNTVLQKFEEKFDVLTTPATAFLDQLLGSINEEFDKIRDLIQDKEVKRQRVFNSAKLDVFNFYNSQMKKYCSSNEFIYPATLQGFHDSTQTRAVQAIESEKKITFGKSQIQILRMEMDNLFSKYKQKNAMNAVSELCCSPAIGIDLGTTFCCVAVYLHGKVTIIPNFAEQNSSTTPSYVAFGEDGSETIGEPAKINAHKNPENTIYDAKRIIGRRWDDQGLQADIDNWPFRVINEGGSPKIKVNSETFYPEQIPAILLDKLRDMAELHLKLSPNSIQKAVITVPAYFDDGQRQATVDAGELAGLEVLTILNEPTAASIAYSLERLDSSPKKVLIFDLGGGTFDVAVVDMKPGNIDVIAVDGDTHLGGQDFDKNVLMYCAAEFLRTSGKDIFAGKESGATQQQRAAALRRIRRLQTYCEKAKKELATASSTEVSVDAMMDGVDLSVKISRDKFEELNKEDFEKTIAIVDNVLKKNGIRKELIDDIVLVGGSSRIPKIQEMLTDYFNGKALNHSILPDHAVAHGAALQAAIMSGEMSIKNMPAISDVTPYPIGVEVVSKEMSIIIPANTKVPCKRKEFYRTAHENQTQVKIKVFQGEDTSRAANNKFLGEFILTGIPPASAGIEALDVWMEVNSMGILHVEAVCKSTRSKCGITINEIKNRLSKEVKRKILDKRRG